MDDPECRQVKALPLQLRPSPVSWLAALLLAAALNAVLFGLMPGLFFDDSMPTSRSKAGHPINVIRIKKPEPPPRVKPKPPEPRPEKKPLTAKPIARPKPVLQQPRLRLSLPFEITPHTPPLTGDIALPDLQPAPVTTPDLKAAYGLAEIDRPLTPTAQVPPQYPLAAKRRGTEGHVRVRFLVTETGAVTEATVLEAVPAGIFEKATLNAVRNWRFSPGTVAGVPVKVMVETTVKFKLDESMAN
jgi:protein TonB